jgi:dGTPase
MNWNRLLSNTRLGQENLKSAENKHSRTQFQRDYDRIIFSSPFRRMQNKTQVFPLPGSVFVHNRLTHSLEVASVGRSLGSMFIEKAEEENRLVENPLFREIGSVVSAACLAHDMGNPPFGHSGEDAISQFFKKSTEPRLKNELSEAEQRDFIQFDGNANAFRLLSHQFNGRRDGGFALTYTTLASIVKYPFESMLTNKPKFGFFQSEKSIYKKIASELWLMKVSDTPLQHNRHPLVILVESADDICYQ